MSVSAKRRTLIAYLGLTALGVLAGVGGLVASVHAGGVWTGPTLLGVALGALTLGLTPASVGALSRADDEDLAFLGARYVRLLFVLKLLALLLVVFGTRREVEARLAAHVFGVMALHRLTLLWPAVLSGALARVDAHPRLRGAELLLANAAFAVVLAEAVLRAWYTGPERSFFEAQVPHPFDRKLKSSSFGSPPNPLGYNDEEFGLEKPVGALRVAAVGDSFFVGLVPREQGFIDRAERALGRNGGPPVQVYNFGIVATDVADYRVVLELDALRFDPDLVLLGLYVGNDIRLARSSPGLHKRAYAIYLALERMREALEGWRLEHTGEFVDPARSTAEQERAGGAAVAVTTRPRYLATVRRELRLLRDPADAEIERAWVDTLAALERVIALCRERRVPLVVVVSPSHTQVSPAVREEAARRFEVSLEGLVVEAPQRRLNRFLAEREVPTLDLLPAFLDAARERDPDAFYRPNDTHWSSEGNEIAGRELARFLAARLDGIARAGL